MTAIAFPLLLGLATAGQQAAPQLLPRRATSRPAQDTQMRIIGLRNTTAEELTATIAGVIHDVDIAIDPRTNTLILLGHSEAVSRVESLVRELDVPANDGIRIDESFLMHNVHAQTAARRLKELLPIGDAEKVYAKASNNSNHVIVSGPTDLMSTIVHLLRKIDRPDDYGEGFIVRIYCLLEGNTADLTKSGLGFPGAAAVVDELARLGFADPGLLFKTLARVEGTSKFIISGSTAGGHRVVIEGAVRDQDGGAISMDLSMTLNLPDGGEACNIHTAVRVPLGDQVVIGAAPHAGATVVLVVRIDAPEEHRRADTGTIRPRRTEGSAKSPQR